MGLALLTLFATSFVVALSGAMMPGTLLTVTISESSRRGAMAGPLLIVGHGILEIALLAALLLGLAPLFNQQWFFILVALLGGGILLWMAVGMFRALPSLSLTLDARQPPKGNLIMTGALMSAVNPYWIIWWATIGITYIAQARQLGAAGIFAFFSGHILADLAWYSVVSTAIGKGRSLFSDRIYKGLIGVCATFLTAMACFLIFKAVLAFAA